MLEPLRSITITFAPADQDDVIGLLRSSASRAGFASRIIKNPANSDEFFLQFYRQDIKLIGHMNDGSGDLDLVIFRNGNLLEPAQFIDAAVENLRTAVSGIASAQFKQVIFMVGDKIDRMSSPGVVPAFSASISFPKQQVMPLTDVLADFANAQQMAVRFQQIAPGAENFRVELYREDLMISGSRVPARGR